MFVGNSGRGTGTASLLVLLKGLGWLGLDCITGGGTLNNRGRSTVRGVRHSSGTLREDVVSLGLQG